MVYICGFQQADLKRFGGYSIGRGFNEGYTSLLEEKYSRPFRWCVMERSIARNVSKLDGAQIEELYNKIDLNGLIVFLQNFESKKEALEFLQKLDYIHLHISSGNSRRIQEISDLYYECQLFAFRCYIYKLLKDLENGLIDFTMANAKLKIMIILSESKIIFKGTPLPIARLEELISNPIDLENITNNDIARFKLML